MFQYNPGEMADLAQAIGGASSHLDDIRGSATNTLVSVREEFEGKGGGNFEQAQLLINSGIDEGVEVCNQPFRHRDARARRDDEHRRAERARRSESAASKTAAPAWQGRPTDVLASPDTSEAEGGKRWQI